MQPGMMLTIAAAVAVAVAVAVAAVVAAAVAVVEAAPRPHHVGAPHHHLNQYQSRHSLGFRPVVVQIL